MIRAAIRLHRNAREVLLAGAHGRAAAWHGSLDIAALNADQHAAISRVHEDAVTILTARLNWLINLDGQIDCDGDEEITAFLLSTATRPVVTTEGASTVELSIIRAQRHDAQAILLRVPTSIISCLRAAS